MGREGNVEIRRNILQLLPSVTYNYWWQRTTLPMVFRVLRHGWEHKTLGNINLDDVKQFQLQQSYVLWYFWIFPCLPPLPGVNFFLSSIPSALNEYWIIWGTLFSVSVNVDLVFHSYSPPPDFFNIVWSSRLLWFSSVQSLSCVQLFVTPWTAALQASLSITNSWSLPKLMSIESLMPSSHLILCCPLLLPPTPFFTVQLSHLYTTTGKTIALTRRTFVGKVMSLLFNMLSRLVITFLPRSKRLLIS